jgi:hypothetical protein
MTSNLLPMGQCLWGSDDLRYLFKLTLTHLTCRAGTFVLVLSLGFLFWFGFGFAVLGMEPRAFAHGRPSTLDLS